MPSIDSIKNSINSYEFHGKPTIQTIVFSFVAIFLEQQALKWAQKRTTRIILPLKGNLKANLLTASLSTATCAAIIYKFKPIREKPKNNGKLPTISDILSEISKRCYPEDLSNIRYVSKEWYKQINLNKKLRVAMFVAQAKEYASQTSWKDTAHKFFYKKNCLEIENKFQEQKRLDEVTQILAEMEAWKNKDKATVLVNSINNPDVKKNAFISIVQIIAQFDPDFAVNYARTSSDLNNQLWALQRVSEILAKRSDKKSEEVFENLIASSHGISINCIKALLECDKIEKVNKILSLIIDPHCKAQSTLELIKYYLTKQNQEEAITIKDAIPDGYTKGSALLEIEKCAPFPNFQTVKDYTQSLQDQSTIDLLLQDISLAEAQYKKFKEAKQTADQINDFLMKSHIPRKIIIEIAKEDPNRAIKKVKKWITLAHTTFFESEKFQAFQGICEEIKKDQLELLDTMLSQVTPRFKLLLLRICIKQVLIHDDMKKGEKYIDEYKKISKASFGMLDKGNGDLLHDILNVIAQIAKTDEERAKCIVKKFLDIPSHKALGILTIAKSISEK